MVGHHPLDVLVVVILENAPQLASMAKSDLRFLPYPAVSCPAYNLGDRRQATFCNLDNLRAEGSPNRLRDVIAETNESIESVLYFAEIGFGCRNPIRARATCRRRYQTTPATPAATAATTRTSDSGSISTPLTSPLKNRQPA